MQKVFTYLSNWSAETDALGKTQGAYAVLSIALFLVAGLISLLNAPLGQSAAFFAIVAGLTFIGNGVIWALLRTFAIPYIEKKSPKPARKKSR